uniref:Axin-1 n=1 Tax=Takifugu rubripes TaxID=31033 RepID=H2U944_TAKRU
RSHQSSAFPRLADLGSSFTEDAPRPPVPGEEGELVSSDGRQCSNLCLSSKDEAPAATPRRPDLDLGYEPEGSASPTPPYLKWAESLHSLLDDQDGIHLFRTFLGQEDRADMLDFWFACSGFRKLDSREGSEEKKVKLAKAIYRKYILDNGGIVSRQIKAATKSFIRDCVLKLHVDPAMFEQAQTEIQTLMEGNSYPLFLKSDVYLEHTRTGGESPKPHGDQSSVSGNGADLLGYLPTLNESDEWRCDRGAEERSKGERLARRLLTEAAPQRVARGDSSKDGGGFRPAPWREAAAPHYVNAGYAAAPATSANDSEQRSVSSDADSLSLTDSSIDGVPPYRHRKQHRREMQESAKANGRVPLPPIPRPNWIPKDIHVEPERFAAELICRLEGVLREREAGEKLEERLRRVRLEEEGHEVMPIASGLSVHRAPPSASSQHYNPRLVDINNSGPFMRDAHEENPESILDDHVRRVMKTPGCQSPGTGRHSPKSRSPEGLPGTKGSGFGPTVPSCQGKYPRHAVKGEASHLYHNRHAHYIHHRELAEPEASARLHSCFHYGSKCRSYSDGLGASFAEHAGNKAGPQFKRAARKGEDVRPYDMPGPAEDVEKNQNILLWLMEGQKEMVQHKRSPYGSVGRVKDTNHCLPHRSGSAHPCVGTQRDNVLPSHPFIQDPTMPPNPAPSPLIQLEEVRRRLEEEKIKSGTLQPKQSYVMEVIQRGRAAVRPALFPPLSVVPAVSDSELSEPEPKGGKKPPWENVTVAYYFCEELIPYRTSVRGRVVTLGQFKELLTKKGNYRYYFKKVSDEFDCGVVFEEVREDDAVLPLFEEKIIGKVEKID